MNKRVLWIILLCAVLVVSSGSLSMYTLGVSADSANSVHGPVIDSMSPIAAAQRQHIVIHGRGFGDVQPSLANQSDGSVVTLVGGSTPVIRIYDVQGYNSWEAGCEDSQWVPKGLIGIYLTSWADNEIVLDGFGSALNVNGQPPWNINAGDPLIVNVQTAEGMAVFATQVAYNQTDQTPSSGQPPIISSVSPISANRLQNIFISGSGFGDTQPQLMNLGDGSVNTVGGGTTPAIRIYDQNGPQSWQAGVQDNPNSGADAIGIVLVKWTDNEIVLGGFGSALSTNGKGQWNLMQGDPLLIDILTANGHAVYTTSVQPALPDQNSTPNPPSPLSIPSLAVSCKSSTSLSNFRVDVEGSLNHNGTGLEGFPILLYCSTDGGLSWRQLTLVITDKSGGFLATWMPDVTGNYLVRAEWVGNSDFAAVGEEVSFVVSPLGEGTLFAVTSNSTISALAFNSTSSELDFKVSGKSGTTGYVAVSVPNSLLADASGLKAYIDGHAISFNIKSQTDSWLISFNYHHSTHDVKMEMNTSTSKYMGESQIPRVLPYVITIILASIIALMLIHRKHQINQPTSQPTMP